MTKRIALFFDGTWSSADQAHTTNVAKLYEATITGEANGVEQVPFYDPGVGIEGNRIARFLGGVAGAGLEQNIAQGYKKLIEDHEEGDEIFLFGYSRGAYTARSLAGLIRNCGILRTDQIDKIPEARKLYRKRGSGPDSDEAKGFKAQHSKITDVHFIGVWDTVGSRGIPLRFLGHLYNWRYRFHDMALSRSVKHAYHALAIDEKRGPFKPSIWSNAPTKDQDVQQVGFAGVHGNIGGGGADSRVSNIALSWIADKARACGLELDQSLFPGASRDYLEAPIPKSQTGFYRFVFEHQRFLGRANNNTEALHPTAQERYDSEDPEYKPPNLSRYLGRPDRRIAEV